MVVPDSDEPEPRPAARVLLCDPEGRILMFRARLDEREFWITPGGGLNADETHEMAAIRELWEETGIQASPEVLKCVWTRSHVFEFRGRLIDQREQYFLLRCDAAPAIAYDNWEEEERNDLLEHRWWTADAIQASEEVFAPRDLGRLLQELLREGPPAAAFDVGI